jgi:ligand-binding sensor domain-containing protein/two-component sensor histidine kinase
MLRCSIILFCFSTGIFSEAYSQKLIFKNYTVSDGMVANPIRRLFQDSKGFLWICTWEGLSKYDGYKFTNYTIANGLSDNNVNDVYESKNGKLYVALNNGKINVIENDLIRDTLSPKIVINRFFTAPGHRVFAVTDWSGICEFNEGSVEKIKQQYSYVSYERMIALKDSLYAVSSPELSIRILNSKFESVAETKITSSVMDCIFSDSRGRLWVGTQSGLMLASDSWSATRQLKFISAAVALKIPAIGKIAPSDMIEENNGTIWIGTNKNLLKIKPNGVWQTYTEKDGLPSSIISCIFQDKEKNIWIGTSLGLTKVTTKNDIQIYTDEYGLPENNVVNVLTGPVNKLIVVTNASKNYNIREFNPAFNVFNLPDKENILYNHSVSPVSIFFSGHDLNNYRNINFSDIEKINLGSLVPFWSIVVSGNVFIGTQAGVLIHTSKKTALDSSLPHRTQCLLLDRKGFLWVGTWQNGLFRIKLNEADPFKHTVEDFSKFLQDGSIRSLFEDSNENIWVGTRQRGVTELSEKNGNWHARHFDQHAGLMSNFIRTINEDPYGNIWLGSFLGLDKLIKNNSGFRIFNFSRINNFFGTINDIAFAADNKIWCGSLTGLIEITDERTDEMPPLPVYITSINLSGKRFDSPQSKKIRLPYDQNQANFEFTSPGFINEKQIMYSYRLIGSIDTAWSLPLNVHSVSYASLQPGIYEFEVRTIGWNGEMGKASVFSFIIKPPFWRTWLFILLLAIGILFLLFAIYKYRINELLKMQRVRNRVATDLHDDIGSTLTNISILSELSKKNLQQPNQARLFLQRITEEVTASGQALDDIIWSVNSRHDNIEETLARMRRYAAEIFDSSNTQYFLDLEEAVKGKKLQMEQRRDIYLIYKESLNNIYKHANAKTVWVTASVSQELFQLTIRDDGKGFIPEQPTIRNGLKNLRWRVEKWKGKINIESTPGKGTIISLVIPVHN